MCKLTDLCDRVKLVLDAELYLQGKISTHVPLEIDTSNDSVWSVLVVFDCARRLYFDRNGFQCDCDGTIRENPVYLLIEGAIA